MDISRLIRAPLTLAKYLDGTNPQLPATICAMYAEVVNQLKYFEKKNIA